MHPPPCLRSVLAVGLCLAWAVPARASCGAAGCAADTASWERPTAGTVRVGYEFEYADQDSHRIGTRGAAFREIRGHHDEEYTISRIHRVTGSADLTDRLGLDVRLPYVSRSHAHVHRHGGQDIPAAWSLSGVGDLAVLVRYVFWRPREESRPMLTATVGGEFPTGWYRGENGAGDEAELGLQPGSHSRDLIAGLSSLQRFSVPMFGGGHGMLPFSVRATAQFNGPGTEEYRLGDTLQVDLGTSYPVRPWLEARPSDAWRAYLLVQLPVYRRVNLIQTVADYNILFGITYRFEAWTPAGRRGSPGAYKGSPL